MPVGDLLGRVGQRQGDRADSLQQRIVLVEHQRMRHAVTLGEAPCQRKNARLRSSRVHTHIADN